MKKTIGILAHVDSGKTTFCEQLLYYTKSIRTLGRVDHKDSFLDNNEIERERGITVFSEQGVFKYNKSEYYLVDTPGHLDFSCEMERALNVIDYGIIIINAAEGVEGHTKTIWNLLKSRNIPIFTFLNKMDRIGADKDLVLDDIKKNLSKDIFFIDRNYFQNNNDDYTLIVNDNMKENICDYDEELMEKYLDGNNIDNEVIDVLKRLVKSRKIYPVMMGSALNNEGIKEFLCALDLLYLYRIAKTCGVITTKNIFTLNRATYPAQFAVCDSQIFHRTRANTVRAAILDTQIIKRSIICRLNDVPSW